MKRILILATIVLGMMSCEKDEVTPNGYSVPTYTVTNKVKVTFNTIEVGDSLWIYSGSNKLSSKVNRVLDIPYHVCNIYNNPLYPIRFEGGCRNDEIIITSDEDIILVYKGNLTIEYL